MIKLLELVLSTNYIEASVGIFLLTECLPMGSCCSQDGLNIVGILHELELMEGVTIDAKVTAEVDDNFEVTIVETAEELVDCELAQKLSDVEQSELIDFMRYIDDTQSVISTINLENSRKLILKLSKMSPNHIVLNVIMSLCYF